MAGPNRQLWGKELESRMTHLRLGDWGLTLIKRGNAGGRTGFRESIMGFILGHAQFAMPAGHPAGAEQEAGRMRPRSTQESWRLKSWRPLLGVCGCGSTGADPGKRRGMEDVAPSRPGES